MSKKIKYQSGQIINGLLLIEELGKRERSPHREAIFKCSCGNDFSSKICNIVSGNTKSCGCIKKNITISTLKRGMGFYKHPLYRTYIGIINRCLNSKDKGYPNYGGRGITVCERWLGDIGFTSFLEDMGVKPSSEYSLDRINNSGDYEPSNCRWATKLEQDNNKRNNIWVEYNGEIKTLSQWARFLSIPIKKVMKRYSMGWDTNIIFDTLQNDCPYK